MKETELDEQTLAAQREEEERRKRLEEQRAQNATPPGCKYIYMTTNPLMSAVLLHFILIFTYC